MKMQIFRTIERTFRECVEEGKKVGEYLAEVFPALLFLALLAVLTHGPVLFSDRIGFDTDIIIKTGPHFGRVGRQGLLWLQKPLGLSWYNLYYAQILTVVFLVLSAVAFGWLFQSAAGRSSHPKLLLAAFGTFYIVSPFWAAQFYFINQSAELTFACVLIPLAIALAERGVSRPGKNRICALLSVLLMQVVFASYQVLILIYAGGVAFLFLIRFLLVREPAVDASRNSGEAVSGWRRIRGWLLPHLGLFFVGFGLYLLTTRLFYSGGIGYLEKQMKWRELGLAGGLQSCFSAIGDTLRPFPPYYSGCYLLFAVLLLVLTVYWLVVHKREKVVCVFILLAEAFLILLPYMFFFVYGGPIWDRMQLLMPFCMGMFAYLVIELADSIWKTRERGWRICIPLLLLFFLLTYREVVFDLSYTSRLYYTDAWRFSFDRQLAHDLYEELEKYKGSAGADYEDALWNRLLIFGAPTMCANELCVRGDVIGVSFFSFDEVMGPQQRARIQLFMNVMGYPLQQVYTEEERAWYEEHFEEAYGDVIRQMPCFPAEGSIRILQDASGNAQYVAIKLGEVSK